MPWPPPNETRKLNIPVPDPFATSTKGLNEITDEKVVEPNVLPPGSRGPFLDALRNDMSYRNKIAVAAVMTYEQATVTQSPQYFVIEPPAGFTGPTITIAVEYDTTVDVTPGDIDAPDYGQGDNAGEEIDTDERIHEEDSAHPPVSDQ